MASSRGRGVCAEDGQAMSPPNGRSRIYAGQQGGGDRMDKKAKKRIQVINKKLATLRQQLKGAKVQTDEASEIGRLEREISAAEEELAELKK